MRMAIWYWQGRDQAGNWCSGETEASSRAGLQQTLQAQGIRPYQLRRRWRLWFTVPAARQLGWMLRQLAILLAAGVPLMSALQGLACASPARPLRRLLGAICRHLDAGYSLSQALAAHPACFDAGFCLAVAAGEQSGRLEQTLERLASEREKRLRLRGQMQSALIYPALILLMALAVLAVMVTTVIPAFKQTFAAFGHRLPPATRWVVSAADWLAQHGVLLLCCLLGLALLLRLGLRRYQAWRDALDRLSLRLPGLGPLLLQATLARWSRALAMLFASGVPLVDALGAAGLVSGNRVVLQATRQVQAELQQGSSLAAALRLAGCFPPLLQQLVAVGESSGALDQVLDRLALYYEQQVDAALLVIASLIEPLMMALLGVFCGGLVWALYLPVFQLGQVVN